MAGRHNDEDGSDIFWPGYVDAVTNLVLNLLFLLTVMTVAVFMFALELGRASKNGSGQEQVAASKQNPAAVETVRENVVLRREVERLQRLLEDRGSPAATGAAARDRTVDVTRVVPEPEKGLAKAQVADDAVVVRFRDDAVAFTAEEHARLLETLRPIVAGGGASLQVEVPTGFSEAKRMGFYRLMAVRNLLIEMHLPGDRISIAEIEGEETANASIVRVRPR